MNTMEKIVFWTAWVIILIAKIPIAIATAIMLLIEKLVTWVQTRLAEWSGEEDTIQAANAGIDILADCWESFRDDYLDMKIEL